MKGVKTTEKRRKENSERAFQRGVCVEAHTSKIRANDSSCRIRKSHKKHHQNAHAFGKDIQDKQAHEEALGGRTQSVFFFFSQHP